MYFHTIYQKENLFDFFNEIINIPNCEEKTRSYIISIFADIKIKDDLSNKSVTLLYNNAIQNYSFEEFRKIADWLFIAKSIYPDSLNGASKSYYNSIAQTAYHKCYIIMNKQWLIFEELADQFEPYTNSVRRSLYSITSSV